MQTLINTLYKLRTQAYFFLIYFSKITCFRNYYLFHRQQTIARTWNSREDEKKGKKENKIWKSRRPRAKRSEPLIYVVRDANFILCLRCGIARRERFLAKLFDFIFTTSLSMLLCLENIAKQISDQTEVI